MRELLPKIYSRTLLGRDIHNHLDGFLLITIFTTGLSSVLPKFSRCIFERFFIVLSLEGSITTFAFSSMILVYFNTSSILTTDLLWKLLQRSALENIMFFRFNAEKDKQ